MDALTREQFKSRMASCCAHLDAHNNQNIASDMDSKPRPHERSVQSAVLIPFVFEDDCWKVILTLRNIRVAAYPGEISFPGGQAEESDCDIIDTALREANEEIGLQKKDVEIIGCLKDYAQVKRKSNRSGESTTYNVSCVVAILSKGFHININKLEVDDVISCPVHELLDNINFSYYKSIKIPSSTVTVNNNRYLIYGFSQLAALFFALILNIIPTNMESKAIDTISQSKSIFSTRMYLILDYIHSQCTDIIQKSKF